MPSELVARGSTGVFAVAGGGAAGFATSDAAVGACVFEAIQSGLRALQQKLFLLQSSSGLAE